MADILSSGHAMKSGQKNLVPNVTMFLKLPPNSRHLLITDKFLRLADVRYPEISMYFLKKYLYKYDSGLYLLPGQVSIPNDLLFKSYIQKCTLSCTSTHYDSSQLT